MRRPNRPRALSKLRTYRPRLERLESLQLLSGLADQVAHPMFKVGPLVSNPTPPAGAYSPSQIQTAYGFNKITFGSVKGDGTGQTIAIVDSYDDPNIQADLNAFDAQYGLPAVTVTRVNQTGGTSYPSTDSSGGWELEESLDVEWAHAIAPGANILLVEASSASDTSLLTAVNYAASHANVVSMSWGSGEFSGETSYDSSFSKAGVAFVASSGDNGAPISWPAASPNVLAVGGTALTLNSNGSYNSESGWSGSGGGPSGQEPQPSYQKGVVTQTTTARANPDVAYDASPSTGFAVYDSFPYSGLSYGWLQVGGTSAGSPQWAALIAIADQGRALSNQPSLDSSSAQEAQTILYANAGTAEFHDITSGTSTGSPNYNAGPGYDYVTGIGTPVANLVVPSLDNNVTFGIDHLGLSAPSGVTAGSSFSLTVISQNQSGATDSAYRGTIQFSSSDVQAGLPSSYTFTSNDAGSHTFTVTLKTAGAQSVTATDAATSAITGTDSAIQVSPAAASQFLLSGLSSSAIAGSALSLTVTAKDPYGNVATGYRGTMTFASSDSLATLPGSYPFSATDAGIHTFSLTFATAGSQSVTVTDSAAGISAGQSGIAVSPAAPTGLAATAVSSGEIDLSWTAAAGATGYTVQRSPDGSTWANIGTAPAGATTYKDTGLSASTTYSYRVQATGGAGSGYSNVASATTGAAPASSSATFVGQDTATQGTWQGTYGVDGEMIAASATALPSYATVTLTGAATAVWASPTSDARALQNPSASGARIASAWYAGGQFSADVHVSGTTAKKVSLYAVDWDNYAGGRSERVDVIDDGTGKVLDSRTLSGFQSGAYLSWNVLGNVTVRVTNLNPSANAVVSGLFFDPKS
jgi:hypothetical protein